MIGPEENEYDPAAVTNDVQHVEPEDYADPDSFEEDQT